jgi:hypothetical protein
MHEQLTIRTNIPSKTNDKENNELIEEAAMQSVEWEGEQDLTPRWLALLKLDIKG